MTSQLPFFEVHSGGSVCLHVGEGLTIFNKVFVTSIQNQLKQRQHTVSIAIPPFFGSRWDTLLSRTVKETATGWLARKSRVSKQQARKAIEQINSLGLRPEAQFSTLAGTPRTLLAVATAALPKPQVLIYSTEALDPSGVREVHSFVATLRKNLDLFAIHISTPAFHGNGAPAEKICPSGCVCLDFLEDGHRQRPKLV